MIQGHGGNIFAVAAQQGCRPEEIIDMSSNINPLGTLPGLIEHLAARLDRIRILPEVDGGSAVRAMATLLGVPADWILAGGGTTQFIYSACAALKSRRVLILGPTYADYTDGCRMHNLTPRFLLATPEASFVPDLSQLEALLPEYDTVFLCNPNNPTGQLIPHEALRALCQRHPAVRFLVDESYLSFVPAGRDQGLSACGLPNVLVLWSVSKIFGMPGLRAGFLVAQPEMIDRFRPFMQPWCLNTLAQVAVCFLGDQPAAVQAFIDETRTYLAREGELLHARLAGCGLTLYPSTTSYFLLRLPEGQTATNVCQALARQRFLIRNCSNFKGLDEGFIRIALKDPVTNQAVTAHLRATLAALSGA